MESVKNLIDENSIYYKNLEYYFTIINHSQKHLHESPDISIESCKSLIEGICKLILSSLDKNYNDKEISKKSFRDITNRALNEIAKYKEHIDDRSFISQTLKFVDTLSETRNARGDISHGKVSPKPEKSSPQLAVLVFDMTKAILTYILDIFFSIEKQELENIVEYKDNPDFNNMLDDEVKLGGKLKYSLALYEQDPIEYFDRLELYLEENGVDNE